MFEPPNIPNTFHPTTKRKTYEERLQRYNKLRARLLTIEELYTNDTVRYINKPLRRKKKRKIFRHLIESSSISVGEDPRPYALVQIGKENIRGLLDSGASISCLGKDCLGVVKRNKLSVIKFDSGLKTADGKHQKIVGRVNILVTHNGITRNIDFYLVPSLSQELYLGIDFWQLFQVAPHLVSELSVIKSTPHARPQHDLNKKHQSSLNSVISKFPSFSESGLGKTSVETHVIDTGDAEPVKQRHYPVSPVIQGLIYEELDRMLSLGVIEESQSAWSSPVVLIRKPGKTAFV